MNALQLVRKRPGPRRGVRRSQTTILAERTERDRRGVEQARARHAQWLANRAARPPDLWHMEAARQAEQAHRAEIQLRAELRRELAEERLHPAVPAVRPPLRPPMRDPEPKPARIEYSPATVLWLARRNSR